MPSNDTAAAGRRPLDLPMLVIAWVVLLTIFVLTVWAQNSSAVAEMRGPGVGVRIAELQGKYLVGTAAFAESRPSDAGSTPLREELLEAAAMIDDGPVAQRLRYIAVVGELGGPARMLEAAAALRGQVAEAAGSFDDDDAAVLEALERVASATAEHQQGGSASSPPPSLASPADTALLRTHLGWFGDLALAPPIDAGWPQRQAMLAPAKRLVVAFVALIGVVAVAALGGLIGLVIFGVLYLGGARRLRFAVGAPRATVYAETFALWLTLFTALAVAIQGLELLGGIAASIVAMIVSLSALAWPVLRGIPFAQVRRDIGLHAGAGIVREALAGVAAYAMTLPLLGLGILLMFALMAASRLLAGGDVGASPFAPSDAPSHPLIDLIADNGVVGIVAAALLASVVAPIVEETMFRGVLYRHLREATRRAGAVVSILVAALVAAFVFAAIHPQGWVAIPALMSLALGFTLAREWRDSLIPGMVAHGLNNGVIVAVLVAAFA